MKAFAFLPLTALVAACSGAPIDYGTLGTPRDEVTATYDAVTDTITISKGTTTRVLPYNTSYNAPGSNGSETRSFRPPAPQLTAGPISGLQTPQPWVPRSTSPAAP